ncbi:acyl-ACP--UDP-N-acetylglucosamine O-acyltransferase [candidate division TA06 bacterium]|nr:acyl-ACP--UDP-N-acetylglucosamine O-acyltransferase [candidate division TA06 bacterium]
MTHIHKTAIVHPKANLGEGVEIGPYSIVGENVVIGEKTTISSSCLIEGWTTIGKECRIFHGAVIGTPPQDVKYKDKTSYCSIGDRNIFREYSTTHRATGEGETTRIGNENFIMAYVHIAHNCEIGSGVVIANGATLAGYVLVEDKAFISGLCPVHQFVRIGTLSFIGGGYRVPQDLVPYMMATGYPLRTTGLNREGLKRNGIVNGTRKTLKEVYRILFRSGLNTSQALSKIEEDFPPLPEVQHILHFIKSSKRGITK